ncbi:menaquinol-cytochrome c reductase cytochrome b/c subunit [Seinonella peptonophila]|uniref:Menaquinol-cytochrome c reductase cytochrome b/c subunit n=1 Tax=Seinonella peptonophila TaxID=112248 RepID=A0A1M4TE37_9BACL|nr:menaquinol-cytochrome c reductase cytochrome b/c subunit [Seinonella peptonophila]SHE42711.1 menaquinol-cytochrome c reductase cytochrome b/c subunit [Seinonella peptonophila]
MSHNQDGNHKQVHYVGDSRVRANRTKKYPPDYSEFPGNNEAFWPDFLLKEWMVAAVFLVGFMTLVMAEDPPLGEIADPTNTSFLPVPDWYFLFIYQWLKYKWAAGKFIVIGTIILPAILFGALAVVPWLDRSKERRPLKRPIATGLMSIALIATVALTWAAEDEHVKQLESAPSQAPANKKVIGQNEAGYQIYEKNACIKCHGDQLQGLNGPSLLGVGKKRTTDEIIKYMNEGKGAMPAGMFQGSPQEQKILADWLVKQKQK